MKKRTLCLAMAAVMAFGLAGCGGKTETKEAAATSAETLRRPGARLPQRPRLPAEP